MLVFEPRSGEARQAESLGRLVLVMHARATGRRRPLRTTSIGLRVDPGHARARRRHGRPRQSASISTSMKYRWASGMGFCSGAAARAADSSARGSARIAMTGVPPAVVRRREATSFAGGGAGASSTRDDAMPARAAIRWRGRIGLLGCAAFRRCRGLAAAGAAAPWARALWPPASSDLGTASRAPAKQRQHRWRRKRHRRVELSSSESSGSESSTSY